MKKKLTLVDEAEPGLSRIETVTRVIFCCPFGACEDSDSVLELTIAIALVIASISTGPVPRRFPREA